MIKSKQLAQALFELSEEENLVAGLPLGSPATKSLDARFFDFLEKRNLKAQMPSILYHLERITKLDLEKKGVQIETAHIISKDTVDKIKSFLDKKIPNGKNVSGKPEVLKIRKELVGGFRAKFDGVIYDASIMTGLKKLEESIIK